MLNFSGLMAQGNPTPQGCQGNASWKTTGNNIGLNDCNTIGTNSNYPFSLITNDKSRVTLQSDGDIDFGKVSVPANFQFWGNSQFGNASTEKNTDFYGMMHLISSDEEPFQIKSLNNQNLFFYVGVDRDVDYDGVKDGVIEIGAHEYGVGWKDLIIQRDPSMGNVGIGTTCIPSGYKLAVNGKMTAHEVKVQTDEWCDYVFDEDYELISLGELEDYIKKNKHLPEIPTTKEVTKNGVLLGEMQTKLLKKVEELTLYTIELKKEIEQLKKQINSK